VPSSRLSQDQGDGDVDVGEGSRRLNPGFHEDSSLDITFRSC
jgi:hypothetical protein